MHLVGSAMFVAFVIVNLALMVGYVLHRRSRVPRLVVVPVLVDVRGARPRPHAGDLRRPGM